MKTCLAVLTAGWVALAPSGFAAPEPLLPKGWEPDLEMVFQKLDEELQQENAQLGMNLISARMSEVRDAQLALVYTQLYVLLPAVEQQKLKREQTAWLKTREKKAKAAAAGEEGGSLAPLEYNTAHTAFTTERLKALQQRLKTAAK
jgi:uncharacterized protein YecT (DUF1311 family)